MSLLCSALYATWPSGRESEIAIDACDYFGNGNGTRASPPHQCESTNRDRDFDYPYKSTTPVQKGVDALFAELFLLLT